MKMSISQYDLRPRILNIEILIWVPKGELKIIYDESYLSKSLTNT